MINMPYDASYIGTNIYPPTPEDYSLYKNGDLLKISFDKIPKGSGRYVNISLLAPSEAPATLYNMAYLIYAEDPNLSDNTATISTYVPLKGYNKTAAVKSFEDLLHNQSFLLFSFQDLILETPPGKRGELYRSLPVLNSSCGARPISRAILRNFWPDRMDPAGIVILAGKIEPICLRATRICSGTRRFSLPASRRS